MPKNKSKKLTSNSKTMGKVRLIGGQWRGRVLTVPNVDDLRPSPARLRETLFNWLSGDIADRCCVDLFAGSGVLGIEAASRGAAKVILIEQHPHIAANLAHQLETLQATQVELIQADALTWLAQSQDALSHVDIFFADPPFHQPLMTPLIQQLDNHALVTVGTYLYTETPTQSQQAVLSLPTSWHLHRQQRAGQVLAQLWRKQS